MTMAQYGRVHNGSKTIEMGEVIRVHGGSKRSRDSVVPIGKVKYFTRSSTTDGAIDVIIDEAHLDTPTKYQLVDDSTSSKKAPAVGKRSVDRLIPSVFRPLSFPDRLEQNGTCLIYYMIIYSHAQQRTLLNGDRFLYHSDQVPCGASG